MSEQFEGFDKEITDNIELAAKVSSCVVLAGVRQFDRFLIAKADGSPRISTLERIVHDSVGASATWKFDPARGRVSLVHANEGLDVETTLPAETGADKELSLNNVIDAWTRIEPSDRNPSYTLLVDAGLLVEDPAAPRDEDFKLLRMLEKHTRRSDRSHILLLRVAQSGSLPNALLTAPQVRTVHIPSASRDVRHAYASIRGKNLARHSDIAVDTLAETLSKATEDWTLDQLDALVRTAERQEACRPHDIEELARAVRIGTTHSPWAGSRVRDAVAEARGDLTKRVQGQAQAIEAVVAALRKSVVGLSSAHQARDSQTPRGVFFFAGPTGTGKTELAKAISQLVFGQEQLLRFDCGELREQHAVTRLIGAPPGYVGHDQGGELTEGISAKPNSVVLFDEIEKAHPRLLDTLLGVLDDGRLTSGRGETALFGQAVLIFTSNLGMYDDVVRDNGISVRRPRFDYDTPFEQIERSVREAIREEFVSSLGRPELLGRLGGAESIIVFDYLRDLERVCMKFVANITAACQRLHGVELKVDETVIKQVVAVTQSRMDALALGGRGLRPELDRWLTNPLADYLFDNPQTAGQLNVALDNDRTIFSTQ